MRSVKKRWNRRDFLRAAGISAGAAALSPLLPRVGEAQVEMPKRLLLIHTGNGSILERWRENGSGAAFRSGEALPALRGPILEPLDRHRDRLLLLDGVDIAACYDDDEGWPPGPNHGHAGASVLWTGVNGGGEAFGGDAGEFPTGASVDQLIADHVGRGTAVGSLQLSTWSRPIDPRGVYSFAEGGVPLPAELDPQAVYDRVFGGGAMRDDSARLRELARRRRTLDVLRGEIGRLRGALPSSDRDRLEHHLLGIDSLESRLDALGTMTSACVVGDRPGANGRDVAQRLATVEAWKEMIRSAFACDLTRVVSLTLTPENVWSPLSFVDGWAPGLGEVHNASHLTTDPDPTTARRAIDSIVALQRWHATQVAEILDLLASVEEAPGTTLLDNTIVVWGMAMSQGGYHTNRNTPFVIAHGSNGPFRTGRYLRWGSYDQPATGGCPGSTRCHEASGNQANNRLLVSLCHGFGLDGIDRFGDARFAGPLPGLV